LLNLGEQLLALGAVALGALLTVSCVNVGVMQERLSSLAIHEGCNTGRGIAHGGTGLTRQALDRPVFL
jgi:hypothetical protein